MAARLDRVEGQLADIRERLARLETSRNADRAEIQAEIARFKVEVERAELQLTRVLPPSAEQSPRHDRARIRAKTDPSKDADR